MKEVYQCEYCLETYTTAKEAMQCEMECLKLTWPEYSRYIELINSIKTARHILSRNFDNAIQGFVNDWENELHEFEEKHGMTDAEYGGE